MTELTRRAFAQGTAKLLWDVASRSLGFLLTVVVARSLGASGFGAFAVYWYTALLLAQLSDLGLHLLTLKRLSRGSFNVLGSTILLKSVLSCGIFTIVALASRSPIILALVAAQLLASWVELFGVALRSRGLLAREGIIVSTLRASWILAASLVVFREGDLEAVGAALALASAFAFLVALIVAVRALPSWGRPQVRVARLMLREAFPLATTSLITLVYLRADLFIVAAIHGAHESGVFQSAFRLFEACFVISGGLAAGTFPLIAARFGTPEFRSLARFVLKWAVLLAIPVAFSFSLFSTPIVLVVYGEPFVEAARPLALLGIALVAVFTNSVTTHCLVAAGRTRRLVAVISVRLVVGVGLDALLVSRYGAMGAAFAVAAAEWSLTAASLWMIRDLLRTRPRMETDERAAAPVVGKELSSCS